MKYYKGRREADKGLITRILIVVLVCLLTFTITVFIGNRLKAKLDRLDSSHGVGGDSSSSESVSTPSTPNVDEKNDSAPEAHRVFTAYLTLSELAGDDSPADRLSELKAEGYTAIALPLTDDDGALLYASDAARAYGRADFPSDHISTKALAELVSLAHTSKLRVIALYRAPELHTSSAAAELRASLDEAISQELAAVGFDEITLLGCIGEDGVNTDSAITVLEYVARLRRSARADGKSPDIALVLNYRYFLDTSCAQQIELFAQYIEVLTIDLRGHDNPAALCDSLSGSFSLYSLRALTDSVDTAAAVRSYAAGNVLVIPVK